MPYRSDLEALEARHAALNAEVAEKVRARDEAARVLADARARARDEAIADDWASGGPRLRRQRRIAIGIGVTVLALMVGGLVRHGMRPSPEEVQMEEVLQKFSKFADDTCECKDKACADAVQERLVKWSTNMAKSTQKMAEEPSRDFQNRIQIIAKQYTDCVTKLYSREYVTPSTAY